MTLNLPTNYERPVVQTYRGARLTSTLSDELTKALKDLSRNPLFQIMFNIADTSERTLTLPGCAVTKLSSADPSAKFDIVLHAPEVDGRIEIVIVYNADLFSEGHIAIMLEQLSYLLSQVAEDPQRGIDEYSLVTPSAQAVLPDPTKPLDDTWKGAIHELFSRQAKRVPDRPAVVDPDELWTYSELDALRN